MKNSEQKEKRDRIIAIIGIIFFIILAIASRSSTTKKNSEISTPSPNPTQNSQEEQSNSNAKILESLYQTNYHFTYTIIENDQTELIDGKVNGNKIKFTIIGTQKEEYAKISNNYLKKTGEKYEIIKTEIRPYWKYISLENLEEILEKSLSKQEENVEIFTIETIDLLDKYTEIEYNGFEDFKDDQTRIYRSKNNVIEKIEIDYSNYDSYRKNETSTFKVTMEFSDFGSIEELEI